MHPASFAINIAIAVLSVVGWLQLMIPSSKNATTLTDVGIKSLKYFTVLSNLFSALVSLAYLVAAPGAGGALPSWLLALKLVSAAAVMLTFMTVLVFLGPTKGYTYMYVSGNLWLHLVVPLLAALDCCLFVPVGTLPFPCTALAILPMVLYGIFYVGRCAAHGMLAGPFSEDDAQEYDFYGFLTWGNKGIVVVFVVMVLASWGLGCALYFASKALCL